MSNGITQGSSGYMPYIQPVSDIGGQIIQNVGQRKQQERAFANNLEMWNRQNVYNSPKMQMARYKEAGLNPNLMYGQGSPGNASQLPRYQAPEYGMQMPDILNMLSQYQNTKTMAAQEQNISADTVNKVTDNSIKLIDKRLKDLEIGYEVSGTQEGIPLHRAKQTRYWRNREAALELMQAKHNLTKQMIYKATTFNKYMDYSQIGGIAGQFMRAIAPLLHMLK